MLKKNIYLSCSPTIKSLLAEISRYNINTRSMQPYNIEMLTKINININITIYIIVTCMGVTK